MIKLHKVWLLIYAVASIPVVFLCSLLAIGGIGSAVQQQVLTFRDLWSITCLIVPLSLLVCCIALWLSLRRLPQIPDRTRPKLLAFYVVAGILSALITTASWSHGQIGKESTGGPLVSPPVAIAVTAFFVIPIVAMWIERNRKPNKALQHTPLRGSAEG